MPKLVRIETYFDNYIIIYRIGPPYLPHDLLGSKSHVPDGTSVKVQVIINDV